MQPITNAQINLISKLHQKKYRDEYGLFFVEGKKGFEEVIKSDFEIEAIVIDDMFNAREIPRGLDDVTFSISEKQIKKIKSVKTWPHIMTIVKKKKIQKEFLENVRTIIVLYKINDPGNLGTIIRTCHWFGIKDIVLSEDSVDPYNEKVVRASMGSFFHVTLVEQKEILSFLKKYKKKGFFLSSFDVSGQEKEVAKKEKQMLIFGSESHGLADDILNISNDVIKIKGKGEAESLNLAVSLGIVISELAEK